MIETLRAFLRALEVTPGSLGITALEAPRSGRLADPSVTVGEVKDLPGLQHDRLPGLHAAALDAEREPA